MMSRMETLLAALLNGETPKGVPMSRNEAYLYALCQKGMGGGGTGGAQPDWNAAEGEPGHILNRTHEWVEYSNDLLLSGLVPSDSGLGYYGEPIRLIAGEEYEVKLSGASTTYKCVAVDMSEGGYYSCVLGNIGALTGEGDTGEPFVIIASDGYEAFGGAYSAMVIPLTEHIPTAVHITGKHYKRKKLDRAWLPIPGVASIRFTVTMSGYNTSVSCNYTENEIANFIRAGFVLDVRADIGGARTIGLVLRDMNDSAIVFGHTYRDHSSSIFSNTTITVPLDGNVMSFDFDELSFARAET